MKLHVILLLVLFCACSPGGGTIKIKGSDTEVNLAVVLAEQFHSVNKDVLVSISGGGSGLGIASLLNGNAHIANSSRSIKPSELKLFKSKSIEIDSFVFAQDAIAFVVSDKIKMDSISVADVAKILSGEYTNWSSLSQFNKPITIYGRQSNSGTHDYVKEILKIHFSPYAKQMNGNAQIIEALKADDSGIGYVSAGYVLKSNTSGLKILSIYTPQFNAVSPLDANAIASGKYYFQRPLFQYYRRKEFTKIKSFLDFEQSEIGATIIKESGYYPNNVVK
jgi:phosphate transport system substrate-binding protein